MPLTAVKTRKSAGTKKVVIAKWTIILFIAAENDLAEDMKDIYDQIAKVGSNPGEVNFIVIFDGLDLRKGARQSLNGSTSSVLSPARSNGNSGNGNNGHVTIYEVTRYSYFTDVTENLKFAYRFPKSFDDLTEEQNLVSVLRKAKEMFRAENYGLIFKGHGGPSPDINNAKFASFLTLRKVVNGKIESDDQIKKRMSQLMKGKGWRIDSILRLHNSPSRNGKDQLTSNKPEDVLMVLFVKSSDFEALSYLTLSKVIHRVFCNDRATGKKKLDLLVLDSCWGQTLENGATFKDVTEFLVASADEMAVLGIGYEGFCNFLLTQPQIKPSELANFIVAEYFQTEYDDYQSSPEWANMGVSLTCIETTYLDQIITLFSSLSQHLQQNLVTHFYIIHLARLQCMAYTYDLKADDYKIYSIDLIWFLENLQEYNRLPSGKAIDQALEELVSCLLRLLSLYYIKSYLASNYTVKMPGENGMLGGLSKRPLIEPVIGGKGIAIIFPSRKKQFNLSFYNTEDLPKKRKDELSRFLSKWKWGEFLSAYVDHKHQITKNNTKAKASELQVFKERSQFIPYLRYYNDSESRSLLQQLNRARTCVKHELEHKWFEVKPRPKPKKEKPAK